MGEQISRRDFLKKAGIVGVGAMGLTVGGGALFDLDGEAQAASDLFCIASRGGAGALTKKAVDAMGGIGKFVKRGNSVVIKPNLAWARKPEQAANTDPEIISMLIKLCKQAGAGRVVVVDHTCSPADVTFRESGAKAVCDAAGVRLISLDRENMYSRISIPKGKVLKSDTCAREILNADVFINVPKVKVHGASTITASMKNLMGANWDRGKWHSSNLNQCIADYSTAVKPNLIILDATSILLTNGPQGPGEVKKPGQVIAATDPVAADAYSATLLGLSPNQVKHIVAASELGLGQIDMKKMRVKRV